MPTIAPVVAPIIIEYRNTGLTDMRLIWMRYTELDSGARPNERVSIVHAIRRLCDCMNATTSEVELLGDRGGIIQLSGTKTMPNSVKKNGTVQNAIHWSSFAF